METLEAVFAASYVKKDGTVPSPGHELQVIWHKMKIRFVPRFVRRFVPRFVLR